MTQTLLYDFYGELLTEHQKRIYENVVFNDLTLSEAAEDAGISRQGVHDLLRRCDKQLRSYESKLHLVERFTRVRSDVERIVEIVDEFEGVSPEKLSEIKGIAGKLMEEL